MTKEEFLKAAIIAFYAARLGRGDNESAAMIARLAREDALAAYAAIASDCSF